jgi:hypothetical protein
MIRRRSRCDAFVGAAAAAGKAAAPASSIQPSTAAAALGPLSSDQKGQGRSGSQENIAARLRAQSAGHGSKGAPLCAIGGDVIDAARSPHP